MNPAQLVVQAVLTVSIVIVWGMCLMSPTAPNDDSPIDKAVRRALDQGHVPAVMVTATTRGAGSTWGGDLNGNVGVFSSAHVVEPVGARQTVELHLPSLAIDVEGRVIRKRGQPANYVDGAYTLIEATEIFGARPARLSRTLEFLIGVMVGWQLYLLVKTIFKSAPREVPHR